MNRQLRDKWITALRSGDYPQTLGQLRRLQSGFHEYTSTEPGHIGEVHEVPAPAGHCCLGVLADVCVREWPDQFRWIGAATSHEDEDTVVFPGINDTDEDVWELTEDEQQTSGELGKLGALLRLPAPQEIELIHFNDGGMPFTTIAGWIEEHVAVDDEPLLFTR